MLFVLFEFMLFVLLNVIILLKTLILHMYFIIEKVNPLKIKDKK